MRTLLFFLFLLCVSPVYASFEDGQKAFAQGNYDKALDYWRQAAEEGDLTAQRNIAHLYRWGKGVPQDLTQAAFWYYTAAKGGLDTAQYNLGVMYLRGEGIPRNEEEGIVWLQRAAEQDNELAKKKLMHLKGEIDHELPTEDDLLPPVKTKKIKPEKPIKMTTSVKKEPPLYAHLASYHTQETLEKGWRELKQTFPELASFKTVETHVTLPEKGKYIRLYIKGRAENIHHVCGRLNEKKQYCLISYP
ncbi:MAG: sel1 repeat family protein [Alphaproteobacteria bacterium]|nr:sel1 repeat family protein [Alphaproteobacteria bacterium]